MSEQKARAVCVGEVLIELARGADGRFALSCGGDAFNTAVYLARAGVPSIEVAFASAIGDDRIQKQTQGYVVPDAFTHGSSAQRVGWFKRGYQGGKLEDCDTFNAEDL